MARQAGPFFFVGQIDDLVFYKQGDKYYVRQKSEPTSTTKKRLKDKNYYPVLNMRKREFGEASQLASEIYRRLPRKLRGHGKQQKLTGKVVRLMRQGMKEAEIKALLLQELLGTEPAAEQLKPIEPSADTLLPKEDQQPVRTQPAQQATVNSAEKPRLSDWKVCGKGRMYKESAKQQNVIPDNGVDQVMPVKSKCCHPCFFYVLVPRLRDAGGG